MTEPPTPHVPARPGNVHFLAEQDYKYGRGQISLRLTRVYPSTSIWFGGEWMWLDAVEIRWDGSDGPNRLVLVRMSALARSR